MFYFVKVDLGDSARILLHIFVCMLLTTQCWLSTIVVAAVAGGSSLPLPGVRNAGDGAAPCCCCCGVCWCGWWRPRGLAGECRAEAAAATAAAAGRVLKGKYGLSAANGSAAGWPVGLVAPAA